MYVVEKLHLLEVETHGISLSQKVWKTQDMGTCVDVSGPDKIIWLNAKIRNIKGH